MLVESFVRLRRPRRIITPNAEYVMIARSNAAVHDLIERADVALPDGVGIKWAGAMLGQPISEVVPGSELVIRMAPHAADRGDRWFLLGAAEGVAREVGSRLCAGNPGLEIAGTFSGDPSPQTEPEIRHRIHGASPIDVLLVAYSSPAQDLWIERNLPHLDVPLAIGVGGTFNFIAGVSPTPPEVVKRLGLIWLFRLLTEPWRWRRQRALARFALLVLRASVAGQ